MHAMDRPELTPAVLRPTILKWSATLLNAAFGMAILDLISQVHLPSSVNTLPKYLKHFTFSFFYNMWYHSYKTIRSGTGTTCCKKKQAESEGK